MNTGILLESLINIAKKPKTDFALSMNMTPSGLSKILTGSRLPNPRERKLFAKQAAEYFTEAIYSYGCYLKLTDVFPVLYDFRSADELHRFFSYAIEYSLDKDFAADNFVDFNYTERAMYFLGWNSVLNMLCVILSDHLMQTSQAPLELYSAMPFHVPVYMELVKRIIIVKPEGSGDVVLNHLLDPGTYENVKGEQATLLLSSIVQIQRTFDLNLWSGTYGTDQSFLLIKGRILLLFNVQIDGTPLLVPIYHKSYLTVFHTSLLKADVKRISYSQSEAVGFLKDNPGFISELLHKGVDSVYSFISIGYLLDKTEIEAAKGEGDGCIGEVMWELFNAILAGDTKFVVSIDAMERFISQGKAIVPLIGPIPIPREQRVPYLQRLNAYLGDAASFHKTEIINSRLSNMAALCAGDVGLLYTLSDTYEQEKIHVLKADALRTLLQNETVLGNMKPLGFSPDLWSAYQNGLLQEGADARG